MSTKSEQKSFETNWGRRYGLNYNQVKALQSLWNKYHTQAEHFHNGDPYPTIARNLDKNVYSEKWSIELELTKDSMKGLAKRCGFDKVDFNSGLWPTLEKGIEKDIIVPSN